MPTRKISPQSFDDILSELGDDPAIPDPHGIRKPNSPKRPDWDAMSTQGNSHDKPEVPTNFLAQFSRLGSLQKPGLFFGIGGLLITLGVTAFFTLNTIQPEQNNFAKEARKEITALKKDLALIHEEILDSEDSLYEAIDLIEVSIHSLEKNRPQNTAKLKLPSIPFESELRHWRYLGVSQVAGSYRAFFTMAKQL